MRFKEGKIIDRFYVKTGELITIRFPRKSDVIGLMKYINSLVGEKTRILLNRKQSLREEKKWLADLLQNSKENKNIPLVIEAKGKIIGINELKRNEGSKHLQVYTKHLASKFAEGYRKPENSAINILTR